MRTEIAALPGELAKQNRHFVFILIGSFVGIAALVLGALQVAG